MSTDDLPPKPQTAVSHSPLRHKLLSEIADVLPPPPASLPQPAHTAAMEEEDTCHPFRDPNATSFGRQVDSLFLLRWLEGLESSKKNVSAAALHPANPTRTAKHH